jgi:N,N'-diacetyllegionaminate synthase
MKKLFDKKKIFVIAEAGVGHFGSLSLGKKLIDAAKYSGADAVKFQAYITEDLVDKRFREWFKRYKKKEVNLNFLTKLNTYAKKKKITFLCTPHTESVIPWISKLRIPIIKVGSGEVGNFQFLEKLIPLKKHLIISTGLHQKKDLIALRNFFKKKNFSNYSILFCSTIYPTNYENLNLHALKEYKKIFPKKTIGYSDHTSSDLACLASILYGAKIIEKHLSIKFNVKNSQDWKVSLDKKKFKDLITKVRNLEKIIKNKNFISSEMELKQKVWASKSLYTKKVLKKGHLITLNDIKLLRPGNGIPASNFKNIIGKKIKKKLKNNYKLKIEDLKL